MLKNIFYCIEVLFQNNTLMYLFTLKNKDLLLLFILCSFLENVVPVPMYFIIMVYVILFNKH